MLRGILKRRLALVASLVLVISVVVVTIAYHFSAPQAQVAPPKKQLSVTTIASKPTMTPVITPTPIPPTKTPAGVTPTPTLLTAPNPATVLGVDSNPGQYFAGISWIRLGYPSCGFGYLSGAHLHQVMINYHNLGLHVLLIVCQPAGSGPSLFNPQLFADIAQSGADAIQCGNEEMKQNALTNYVAPADFARFFDMCTRAV